MASEKRKVKKGSGSTFLLVLILLVGLGLISYPSFADYWNNFHQSKAIASYVEAVAEIPEENYTKMWKAAKAYNKALLKKGGSRWSPTEEEKKKYNSILDITGTGIMGYIEIPSINVNLPIYHGTDEEVLQVAIGHLVGSSLPIGGKGTHAVVSGHRGLPSAKLFTNLDKLKEGDVFIIRVLNEVRTYQVNKISVVLPDEMEELDINQKKDWCTLVTCTPYGINTHRLLVRGKRIRNFGDPDPIIAVADAQEINRYIVALCMGGPVLLIIFLWDMLTGGKRRRKHLEQWEKEDEKLFGGPVTGTETGKENIGGNNDNWEEDDLEDDW
ncbi:MAG: class C sortase [Blautia sp.]|nr:class C sortase [Blautia sp.]